MNTSQYIEKNKNIKNVLKYCININNLDLIEENKFNKLLKKICEKLNNFFLSENEKIKCTYDKYRFYFDKKLSDDYSLILLYDKIVDYIESVFNHNNFSYDISLDLSFVCPSIGFENNESDFE